MLCVQGGNVEKRLRRTVHKVVAAPAVNMEVDESGNNIMAVCIYFYSIGETGGRRADIDNFTRLNQHAAIAQSPERRNNQAICEFKPLYGRMIHARL